MEEVARAEEKDRKEGERKEEERREGREGQGEDKVAGGGQEEEESEEQKVGGGTEKEVEQEKMEDTPDPPQEKKAGKGTRAAVFLFTLHSCTNYNGKCIIFPKVQEKGRCVTGAHVKARRERELE